MKEKERRLLMNEIQKTADEFARDTTKEMRDAVVKVASDLPSIQGSVPQEITSDGEQLQANERLKYIGGIIKRIEDVRRQYTRPLDGLKKQLMDVPREILAELEAVKKDYRLLILAYDDKKREEVRKAEEAAEAERWARETAKREEAEQKRETGNSADIVEAEEIEEQADAVAKEDTSVAIAIPNVDKRIIRRHWKAQVIDQEKVPRKYLVPDIVKLNELARIHNGDNAHAPEGVAFIEVGRLV